MYKYIYINIYACLQQLGASNARRNATLKGLVGLGDSTVLFLSVCQVEIEREDALLDD